MASFKLPAATLAAALLVALAWGCSAQRQRATLYSSNGGRGNSLFLDARNDPDLRTRNWNNVARSACVNGVWLFYDWTDYNTGRDASMEYMVGNPEYCNDISSNMAGKVTSVRFAGYSNNYKVDTFTLYENVYFQGIQEYIVQDTGNLRLDRRSKSIILTGTGEWTVYDQPDFRGAAACIHPDRSQKQYDPALIYDMNKLVNIPWNTIRSVRKGCFGSRNITVAGTPSGLYKVDRV